MNENDERTVGPAAWRDPGDGEIELRPHLLLLWRRRLAILLATLVCGVIAWMMSAWMAPVYDATVRICVGEQGSTPHAEVLSRLGYLATDQAVAAHVVQTAGLSKAPQGMTATELQAAVAASVGAPVGVLFVTVRLRDGDRASRAASALAAHIAQVESTRLNQAVEDARKAALDFSLAKRIEDGRAEGETVDSQRENLSNTLAEIAAERARLREVEDRLAATHGSESGTSLRAVLVQELTGSRIALAGLEAKAEYLSDAITKGAARAAHFAVSDDEFGQQRLEARLTLAQRARVDIEPCRWAGGAVTGAAAAPPALDAFQPEVRRAGRPTSQTVALALVFGFLASVAGVIAHGALRRRGE